MSRSTQRETRALPFKPAQRDRVFSRQEQGPDVAASGVAALLAELRGRRLLCDIAERSASNRYTVSRSLKGTATPKLPELLRMIDACNGRALDFVATLADPAGAAVGSAALAGAQPESRARLHSPADPRRPARAPSCTRAASAR